MLENAITKVKNNGDVWLQVEASNGKKASINIEHAFPKNTIVHSAIRQWARDNASYEWEISPYKGK